MMSRYAEAELLYLQVLDILGKNFGEEHPNYVSTLQNLELLHQSMGDYAKAE